MIENTSESMKDSHKQRGFLAGAFVAGTEAVIEQQERAGQTQFLASEQLPTDLDGDSRADFEAVGFTFGDPTPGDPLFQSASLPNGWRKTRSDNDLWTHIVDTLGRRRAAVFYKAAYYDRRAFMRLNSLHNYVSCCVREDALIITDDTWATPAAVAEECRALAERAQLGIDTWASHAKRDGENDTTRAYVGQYTAERDKYNALAASFEAGADA